MLPGERDNRIPTAFRTAPLPWFERRVFPGGELGPIYGPKYMRIYSRISVAYVVVMTSCIYALPNHVSLSIVVATAVFLVWTRALQVSYRRKWKLEQSRAPGEDP